MRRRGTRAHQIDEWITLVADVILAVFPIRRARVVRDDPGAAGIHPFGDDGESGDQLFARQDAVADDILDLLAQAAGVELCLQQRDRPALTLERIGRELEIEVLHLLRSIAKRERTGNDGARRGSADEIEVIAETNVLTVMFAEKGFDTLQESDGESAPDAAAVEREQPLGTRPEQMTVARALDGA